MDTPANPFRPAQRSGNVAAFLAMDVLSRARALEGEGRDIVHMEVGQPEAPVPEVVIAASREKLETGVLSYTEALGTMAFRRAVRAHMKRWYSVDVPVERIVAITGSSGGFMLAFLACFNPRARVALPVPGYPAYRNTIAALDLAPVLMPLDPATGFIPSLDDIAALHAKEPLDGLLLASPNNPTGTVIPRKRLGEIAAFCRANGIRLISDEIYHGLVYGTSAETALAFDPDAIVVNSLSKFFCMTGWRIGWMIVPEELVRPVERLQQNLFICPPDISQAGAVAALENVDAFAPVLDRYRQNRALFESLPSLGFGRVLPMDGAFYAYADITPFGLDALTFTQRMLEEASVAATPGLDFDPLTGGSYVRFSYAGAPERMGEGIERLKRWLSSLG
ncbi:MAG: aminotransferase class I/II-fold pyridoxal phosphate-dependent enzyme [Pseudomonadota bacterium]